MVMKKNIKNMQKPKTQNKSPRSKCQSRLNQSRFSGLFIYDSLDVFYKPMRTIKIKIMR